jgi:hypothetical protein
LSTAKTLIRYRLPLVLEQINCSHDD